MYQSHCNFKPFMKFSCYSLISFLPLFCNWQFRRLHSRLLFSSRSESESYVTTDSQWASLSWYKPPIWAYDQIFTRAEQSNSLLPATSQHGHGRAVDCRGTQCVDFYRVFYVLYNPSARTTWKTQPLLLRRHFTGPLPSNGRPSVARVRSDGMCLPCRSLVMSIHVTISSRYRIWMLRMDSTGSGHGSVRCSCERDNEASGSRGGG
jgi:hypothetical protein